jgi:tetratricopeptide (TPR) repeat protein
MRKHIIKIFFISILIYLQIVIASEAKQSQDFAITTLLLVARDENTEHQVKINIIENTKDYVFIKIPQISPSFEKKPKEISFGFMKKYFDNNKIKISVIWQKDEYSYGANYSLAGVYIKDYLNKKINKETLINYINEEDVFPLPVGKNQIKQIKNIEVSKENILISSQLREKADLYRLNKQNQSAYRIYEQAVSLNPRDVISLYWMGEICKSKNDVENAKKYFYRVLELSPQFTAADNALFELKNNKIGN